MTAHAARDLHGRAHPDSDSTKMEHDLLLTFADAFRVAPLGNAQSAWAKQAEEEEEEEEEERTKQTRPLDSRGSDST